MGKTKSKKSNGKGKGQEGDWNDGDYTPPPQGDFDVSPKDKKPTADLSDALMELDITNKPPESATESMPKEPDAEETEETEQAREKVAETSTARVELIKSVGSAYSRLKEIEADATQKTQAHKNKINKLFWDLQKISEGLEESKGSSMEEMAKRTEQLNSQIEKIDDRILQIKNEIKTMVDGLVKEEKEQKNKAPEIKESTEMPQDKLCQLVELLDKTDSEDMSRWAMTLRVGLPQEKDESSELQGKRKYFTHNKEIFSDTLAKLTNHIKQSGRTLERMAAIEKNTEGKNANIYLEIASLLGLREKTNLSKESSVLLEELRKKADGLYGEATNFVRLVDKEKKEDPKLFEAFRNRASVMARQCYDLSVKLDNISNDEEFEKINKLIQESIAAYDVDFRSMREDYNKRVIPVEIQSPESVESVSSEADQVISDLAALEAERVVKETTDKETPVEIDLSDIEKPEEIVFEENLEVFGEQNEKIQQLSVRLVAARNKLKEAFVKKEKASGVVGKFKKHILRSKESEIANQEYESAWDEYANLQKEMIEANQKQAENLREFLKQESNDLQAKIAEYYKGKENIISKVWRRLGEMNLANYLEKKSATVKAMEEQGEEIGKWDKFWANRAKATEQNKLYKIGAKVLSVRLGISMGLLGCGIFGIPGAAIARGAFVGLGSAMGSRHLEDAAQNKIQRWLGNRGEFYSSSEEAQKAMADKYGIVEKTMDEDADPNEPEDKKTARRRAKFEKLLGKAEKDLVAFESLPVDKRIEKIQEKISAIEAYAYVNGLDLSKDASYQQLVMARETNMEQFLAEKAIEAGDERPVVRPDSLEDAMAFLESRKKELAKTAEKVAGEKELRWIKRGASAIIGVASGTYAYFATLSRAEIFGGSGQQAPESVSAPTATVPEAEISPVAPTQPEILVEENIIPENIEPGSDDLSKRIIESATIRKGEGLERTLQRQLAIDPQKFGYQGDLEDASAIKKWAGREASLIAQKQGIDDKYFIYNENQPKLLILHEDKTVGAFGRLHHVSEIARAKAAEVARLAQESAVESATPETAGGVTDVREVIDIMSGGPKMLTEAEQMEFNRLFDSDQIAEAMQYLMEHRARGPIFETADGLQVHRADIGGWEGNAPGIELPSGSKIEFLDNSSVADWKPPSGPAIDMDEYLAERSIPEELVEKIGDDKSNQFLYHSQVDRINDYSQALEQVNPSSDEHRAIIDKLKRELELFNQNTGQDPSKYFDKDFVNRINSEPVTLKPMEESAVGQPDFDQGIKPEIFESAPLNSVNSRYGAIEFDYENGQPATLQIPDNIPRNLQNSIDKVLIPPDADAEIPVSTSAIIETVDIYDNIYVDMQNQGLQNTAEAGLIKENIQRLTKMASKNLSKSPEELFNEDIVNRYDLKNK